MLEKMIEQLTDDQLKECFNEIVKWRELGVLEMGSLIRDLWNEYKTESGDDLFPIHMMSEPILFEICKRKM